jgi:hypothetical protein
MLMQPPVMIRRASWTFHNVEESQSQQTSHVDILTPEQAADFVNLRRYQRGSYFTLFYTLIYMVLDHGRK